ncbi:MAG: hypothetical protein M1819_002205 [Sarea resinae]|nr:MAG: hypothetical protein M1819_002205 [Sarea resinae]
METSMTVPSTAASEGYSKMLPPVDPAVLAKNPQFEKLYKQLISSKLNPDGSTKGSSAQESRDAIKEEMKNAEEEAAKCHIIRTSLKAITVRADELPNELLDVIEIVATQLNSSLSAEERELLEEDVEYFLDHLHAVGKTLSSHISELSLQVAKVAHPEETKPQMLAVAAKNLPGEILARRQAIIEKQDSVVTQRIELVNLATKVLAAHRELQETTIRVLEQTKHGSVSRAAKARAEHLAVVAEGMDAKLRLTKQDALNSIYTPPVRSALKNYLVHLQDSESRLEQRRAAAERELQRYEAAGDDMDEITARYATFLKEMEEVAADIKRLGGNI